MIFLSPRYILAADTSMIHWQARIVAMATSRVQSSTGFKISAAYRRNFGVFFVFGPHRLLVYRCLPVFFVLNFKNLKKIINNHQKNWEKYDKKLEVFIS